MSLGSVLQTALTGLAAAEAVLDVTANNLANWRTAGFKAGRAAFATQTPQTQSLGAAPSGGNGGTNPIQIGSGVELAQASADFSQGQIALDPDPASLALQGDGLFILEGPQGGRLYTRNGQFQLNADHELIASGGQRVMGFGVDENFQLGTGQLRPLRIPLGNQVAGAGGSTATCLGFEITSGGRIRGRFSDGVLRDLGQIRVARFANPSGLQARGDNVYAEAPNSGLPVESDPGEAGAAEVTPGAVELSNTDVGQSLVDLQQASIQFRANLETLRITDRLFEELLSMRRTG